MRFWFVQCVLWSLLVAFAHADARVLEVALKEGPHAPKGAPDAIVVVDDQVKLDAPLDVVVFLHGFSSCARVLAYIGRTPCREGEGPRDGYALADLHEQSGSTAVLIVPQLAYLERDANAPRFARAGGFDSLVAQSLEALTEGKGHGPVRRVALLAHSAGYRAAATILKDRTRELDIASLVFFDALYAHADLFARYVREAPNRRVLSLHTAQTEAQSDDLARRLAALGPARTLAGPLSAVMRGHPVVIAKVKTAHGKIPQAYWIEVMRGLQADSALR